MNVAEVKAAKELAPRSSGPQTEETGSTGGNQIREIAEMVKRLNESGRLGPQSELQFTVDQATGHPLIRIVDRITDEVITQFPSESMLRAAEVLKNLQLGDRIA
jgi:flagellar protein FlaG